MFNAGNVFFGHGLVAAHGAARDRRHHAMEHHLDRQAPHHVAAHLNPPSFCQFCEAPVRYEHFLAHLETCPRAAEDPQKKLLASHEYNSSTYVLHRELQKLREACEVSFFEAKQDPGKLVKMACRLCKSNAEHLAGGCIENQQKAFFMMESNKIAARVLTHFEQSLYLKAKIAVDQLVREHEEYFNSIEDLLNAEPAGLDAWKKIEETTNQQHREKTQLINDLLTENQQQMESFKTMVQRTVQRFANQMDEYLADNERNVHHLHLVIAGRIGAQNVEEVADGAQEQQNGIDEEGVAALEEFFANRAAAGIER